MASGSTQPGATASKKSILTPVMSLEGHELSTRKLPQNTYHNLCISYFPDGEQMISGSEDQTVRRWDLRAGKEIEGARGVCEQGVHAVMVSKDGRWAVAAGGDDKERGELKVWEIKTGTMKTFEGHSQSITCIDISADGTLLASGGRYVTGAVRIWSLDTGKLLVEISASDSTGAIRFSHDSKKLAVISGAARCLEVWNIESFETQKLDIRLVRKYTFAAMTHAPVFWTAKDKTIVAAFNFKDDDRISATKGPGWQQSYDEPKTIYEFNVSTLQTIRTPFEGHSKIISDLALSSDGALLASASEDQTIKLWAFESRQLLASFDVHAPDHLAFSPNSHQLAYTTWSETKIYICDTPPHILATIQSTQEAQPNESTAKNPRLLNLNSDATRRAVRRNPIQPPIVSRPLRDSPTVHPQERTFLRHLRKILPFRMTPARTDQPDAFTVSLTAPLQYPATLPLPRSFSSSAQATSQAHSDMNSHENTRLRHSSTRWPARAGHTLPPIVNVPLAPGKLRIATAGAPTFDEDLIRDEDYVPSTSFSPHPTSQQPFTGMQITTGQHGSGRLCGCF